VPAATDGRYGLLSAHDDATIALYAGYEPAVFHARLDALRSDADATSNQYTFVLAGTSHVVLATPNAMTSEGLSVADWIRDFATREVGFESTGP
jgi:hypothetical protein